MNNNNFISIKKTYDEVFFGPLCKVNVLAAENEILAECSSFEELLNTLVSLCSEDEIEVPEDNYSYKLEFLTDSKPNAFNLLEVAQKFQSAREILNYFKYTTELHFVVEIYVNYVKYPDIEMIQDKNNLKRFYDHTEGDYRVYRLESVSELEITWFCSNQLFRISEKQFFYYF